jgi:hypothetical protein
MTIDTNELTLGQLKEISAMFPSSSNSIESKDLYIPLEIGKSYLFRTVTHIEVGRVKSIHGPFVTLESASWIADTGRYHNCLRDGTFDEVEPYPDTTTINSLSLINHAPWDHALPTDQK